MIRITLNQHIYDSLKHTHTHIHGLILCIKDFANWLSNVGSIEFLYCFQDESVLIWFSGKEEKRLKLTNVSRIISGQRTVSLSK
jgi:hypothetical protein